MKACCGVAERVRMWRGAALLALLAMALVVRVVQAVREPVVNPDCIRFIAQAKALWINPIVAVRDEVYHPLHSFLGGLVYHLIHSLFANDRMAWLASMQTVGIISGVCVTWMIVKLSRHFGAPWWAGMGAGLLFAVGRRTSSYGPDGLSDMLFLTLFAGAILAGLNTRLRFKRGWWLLAGVLAGLSYLTRPEGAAAVIILAAAMKLAYVRDYARSARHYVVGMIDFLRKTERQRQGVRCVILMLVGFMVIAAPYMLAIGHFTAKKAIFEPTTAQMMDSCNAANILAVAAPIPILQPGLWAKIWIELTETFGFGPCLISWLALLLCPRPWGRRHWRPLVYFWFAFWIAVMVWLIKKTSTPDQLGYLDGRHTLALQLVFFSICSLALAHWQKPMVWWQNWWRRKPVWNQLPAWMRSKHWPAIFGMSVCVLGCLPSAMHLVLPAAHDKQYIRAAAAWAAQHVPPDYTIADANQLVGYYSGLSYCTWNGSPADPQLFGLPPKVLLTYTFYTRAGEIAPDSIGPYVPLPIRFTSDSSSKGDLLVFYVPQDWKDDAAKK